VIPTDPVERDELAAEFVLGTLDAQAAREVERAMATDAALRDLVAAWEGRLAPLTALALPEAPPPGLWDRIAVALDGAAPATAVTRPAPSRFWRFWALGASAVAAGLAAFLVLQPVPEQRLMTVLLTQRDQPAWLVEADGGALRLASLNPQPVPSDRVMQLWALPQGATAPTSLGLIPAEQGRLTVTPSGIRPEPGMLIEITLEPPGGSPTGRPTGPILFIGRLASARGA
jgi:anti-sigma-K factor RskA